MTTTDSASTCPATQAAQGAIAAQAENIRADLATLVSFNSVHNEPGCEEDNAAAVAWLVATLDELDMGLAVSTYHTSDGSTAIVAHRDAVGGQPTVLLYSHYDIVPVGNRQAWATEPLTLTDKDGRWYGRGAADCKGNVVAHLAALRAVAELGDTGMGLTVLIEGSEERGGAGLEDLIDAHPELVQADAIMIVDTGNVAEGQPTLTTSLRGGALLTVTVDTLDHAVHSGGFGGCAPDAVAALMRTLDSLRDESGLTTIDGVDCTGTWEGVAYDANTFRGDAGVLDGVKLMGEHVAAPADLVWARPAVTVIGFDSTPVAQAVNAIPATATAKLNLRVPAGQDAAEVADKLKEHVIAHTPWGARVTVDIDDVNQPFAAGDAPGQAMATLKAAMRDAFGADTVEAGSGGSIPLAVKLQQLMPDAEIALYGVEEPATAIHSPNESVSPEEIAAIAVAETLFLLRYPRRS